MATARNDVARAKRSSDKIFLKEIERFIVSHEMTPTYFGARAVGDPNFVFKLRDGRSTSLKMVDQVLAFMADNRHDIARCASFKR